MRQDRHGHAFGASRTAAAARVPSARKASQEYWSRRNDDARAPQGRFSVAPRYSLGEKRPCGARCRFRACIRPRRRGTFCGALVRLVVIVLSLQWPCHAAWAQPQPEVLLEGTVSGEAVSRPGFENAPRGPEREDMVASQVEARDVSDERVLAAMRRVPRHQFVPDASRSRAYADMPLAIGHGQTISQPYIVGFMTEMLNLEPGARVLEVGTGSAYQAAILGDIVREVVSIEIIEPLARSAAERLDRLGYRNITVLHGDGYYGYEQAAPFDAIIVTAAASHVPPPLVKQLKPGGRIAIPVGRGWTQNLLLVEKDEHGETSTRNLMAVRFVPLTGEH